MHLWSIQETQFPFQVNERACSICQSLTSSSSVPISLKFFHIAMLPIFSVKNIPYYYTNLNDFSSVQFVFDVKVSWLKCKKFKSLPLLLKTESNV